MPAPHWFHPKGSIVPSWIMPRKGDQKKIMVRVGPREVGHIGLRVLSDSKIIFYTPI